MYKSIYHLHLDMIRKTPTIFDTHKDSTAGLYLSQFSAFHINVMTSLFGSWGYRTAGERWQYQQRTACYANTVFNRSLEARNARLAEIKLTGTTHGHDRCEWISLPRECPKTTKTYKDTKNLCDWKVE